MHLICSKYNSDEWYFTTLTTPFLDGDDYDGTHPVSGNRAFGIKQNSDGSYTIFTRGVDRVRYRVAEITGNILFDDAFENADVLWTTFQENLVEFIEDPIMGGQAQVILPATHRVDFEAVRNDLMEN